MFQKMNDSKTPPIRHREQCYACFRAKANCLCDSIKPFSTRMRFIILMHTKEARREKTGTARLAKLCLTNAELLTGTDFTQNERVNTLIQDPSYYPCVLFPGPRAITFSSPGRDLLNPEGKTLLIFVLDGTWSCAKKILNKSKNLHALPRLSFSRSYISRFIIKRQPKEHCISTIEAIYYLCKEAEEAGYESLNEQKETLMVLFKKLVDTQILYQKKAAQAQQLKDGDILKAARGIRDPSPSGDGLKKI